MTEETKMEVRRLGRIGYAEAYELQKELIAEWRSGSRTKDILLLLEHNPVITIGSANTQNNFLVSEDFLRQEGIEVHRTNRGGDITYHGPGQIVGYPIFDLRSHKKDIHLHIRRMEEAIIRVLSEYDIKAGRIEGLTGVWVGHEKIAAIGIGVSHWISFHGFAFNIAPNLKHFSYIVPCGITNKGVTSLSKILKREIPLAEVEDKLIRRFEEVFYEEA